MIKLYQKMPLTVDEAVNQIIAEMSLCERVMLAKMPEERITWFEKLFALYLDEKLKEWSVNKELIKDCHSQLGDQPSDEHQAATVIFKELWRRLRKTHRLRLI